MSVGWQDGGVCVIPSDLSPLSLHGRHYDSADSATNGRSDVESVSGSSRLTSRQHSLESRQSLDLSDRWVSPKMLQCWCCRVLCSSFAHAKTGHNVVNKVIDRAF